MKSEWRALLRCFPISHQTLLVLLLLKVSTEPCAAFFSSWSAAPSLPRNYPETPVAVPHAKSDQEVAIRIRSTTESDLPSAASFLSSSVGGSETEQRGWGFVKAKREQMFAKMDIEELLKGRLQTIRECREISKQVQVMLANRDQWASRDERLEMTEEELFLQLWWKGKHTNRMKSMIEKASRQTGEDNIWRQHNFALTPESISWLNHLQITAVDDNSSKAIGFCEVAMLSNPLLVTQRREGDDESFSPAVTNLASAPSFRRRGVATRLLRSAERYVKQRWGAEKLALYVEQTNEPAISLYEKMGYKIMVACGGADNTKDMWYMVKDLGSVPKKEKVRPRKEKSQRVMEMTQ